MSDPVVRGLWRATERQLLRSKRRVDPVVALQRVARAAERAHPLRARDIRRACWALGDLLAQVVLPPDPSRDDVVRWAGHVQHALTRRMD